MDMKKPRMNTCERLLFYACCGLFIAWLGMGWCAWKWYQVSRDALKLLEIVAPNEKAD